MAAGKGKTNKQKQQRQQKQGSCFSLLFCFLNRGFCSVVLLFNLDLPDPVPRRSKRLAGDSSGCVRGRCSLELRLTALTLAHKLPLGVMA